ncbi:MAG: hypothetical protein ACLGI6_04675 [Gammaproteobacteria bacterium]
MKTCTLRIATGLVLSLAALGASAAQPTTKPIDIQGVLEEKAGPAPRCASQFGGALAGFGKGELTGRVAFVGSDCITPSGYIFNFSDGRLTILTLAGDQIFATYSGQFVPTGEGSKYVFNGATFQITGGKGRYADATGGGTLTGGEDMITGVGTIRMTGQITFKGR